MSSMALHSLLFLLAPRTITAERKLRQEMVDFITQNIEMKKKN